ncbi:MAG: calcium-binding protein, partial [Alphaproteobacteria bacterium]|nr:calcium-binding protein [Alphaproteobacteria bacterium]
FGVSATSLVVTEGGLAATFTVALGAAPESDVVLTVRSADTSEFTVAPEGLVFTSADWSTEQTVTVTGADDRLLDGDRSSSVVLSMLDAYSDDNFDGTGDVVVAVTTTDDDTAGFVVSQAGAAVTEAGSTTTFTVVLEVQPPSDVVFSVSSPDTAEATVSAPNLTFTA